jgi:hypothetical protein
MCVLLKFGEGTKTMLPNLVRYLFVQTSQQSNLFKSKLSLAQYQATGEERC